MQKVNGTDIASVADGKDTMYANVAHKTIQVLSADGAITSKTGLVMLTKSTTGAFTIAAPTVGGPGIGDDGKYLVIQSTSTGSHVITSGVDGFNAKGSSGTATCAAAIGSTLRLTAYNGHWYVSASVGITVA